MKSYLIPIVCLLFLAACGSDAPKNDNKNPQPDSTPPVATDSRPPVYLEGIYATSNLPAHEVYDLFDNDPNTGWQTQPGAGPDEGIMLYFADALPLQSVQIILKQGSLQGKTAFIQTYINGFPGKGGKPGDTISLGQKPVKSLYLRFVKTGEEQNVIRTKDDQEVEIEKFPAGSSVSVKELIVFGDKGQALRLVSPQRLRGTLQTTSTLAPESAYSPANLFDARKEFVWVEGNPKTSGEGDTLTFEFQQPVNISAIQIWNGYQRSDLHFAANARLRDFQFGVQGSAGGTYTLRDTKAGQKIEISAAAKGQIFTLIVKSVYPGKRYKDLALSDILFFDGAQPFVLSSELSKKYEGEMRRKMTGSPILEVLNRRISNVLNEADVVINQSLILRSDGTFVLYSTDILPNETEHQTLADGNWELVNADGASATVRVFGKWNNVSDFIEYYKGKTKQEATLIFSDELTTDGNKVEGKKLIGTFYIR